MKRRFLMVALLGLSPTFLWGDTGGRLYERTRSAYFASKQISNELRKKNEYRKIAGEFRKFVEIYPDHPKLIDALFNLGSIYKELAFLSTDRESAATSVHYFRDLVAKSPKSRLADDAWYGIYETCQNIFKDAACAAEAKKKIQIDYRDGDVAAVFKASEKSPLLEPTALEDITVEKTERELKIRLKLNQPTAYVGKSLPSDASLNLPERYFIDLKDTVLSESLEPMDFSTSKTIAQLRFGKNEKGVRVVLDLKGEVKGEWVKADQIGSEIVLLVPDKQPAQEITRIEEPPFPVSPSKLPTLEQPIEKAEAVEPIGASKLRIVLDPGHGGEDSGARGKKGTQEKDICLKVALLLKELLVQNKGYQVFMTRNEDYFVPLSQRTKYANQVEGDLFVSIHANASPRRAAEGVSTYFLDNHDDAEALRVAMRENEEPAMLAAIPAPESDNKYLEIMKASMVKNFHTVQSTEFARKVQISLLKELRSEYRGVEDLGVKSARFYVLTGAAMPSVLVETSFISNPVEEKRLREKAYQRLLARAIMKGIDQFFKSSMGRGDHAALYR